MALSSLRRLVRGNELMGCSACQRRRKAALEKRRQLLNQKVQRLTDECNAGNESVCLTLRSVIATENFRRDNQFRPEMHRRY